jgi:NADH-quinone oxidoreductase subunit E
MNNHQSRSEMGQKADSSNQAPENLLLTLKEAQARFGYLPREFIVELAGSLHVPVNDVYGVASFYSFLAIKPLGRHIIRICKSLPCYLNGCQLIIETLEKEIGIKPGETTPDGRFTFELTNCIGLCDKAPAMLIDSDAQVDLTSKKISRILQNYK